MPEYESSQLNPSLEELIASFKLDQAYLKSYVDLHFDGNLAAFGRSLDLDEPPHRKTIQRWVQGEDSGLPKSPQRLLALARTLDIDPLMLLSFTPETFAGVCRQMTWNSAWGKYHKALSFLGNIFGLNHEIWPDPKFADGYDQVWHSHDWEHHAAEQQNYYQRLYLQRDQIYDLNEAQETENRWRDRQVWYLAFRDAQFQGSQTFTHAYWRPFGFCYVREHEAHLLNGWGEWQRIPLSASAPGVLAVEFYCGPGSAIFRLASLHEFEILEGEAAAPDIPVLRFGFPQ